MKKIITLLLCTISILTICSCNRQSTTSVSHTPVPTSSPAPTEEIPNVKVKANDLFQNLFTDCDDILVLPKEPDYQVENYIAYYLDFVDEQYGESLSISVFFTPEEQFVTSVNISIGFDTPAKMYEASRKDPTFVYNRIFNSIVKTIAPEYDINKLLFDIHGEANTDKFFIVLDDVDGSLFATFILE